jgi:hypothetical protein
MRVRYFAFVIALSALAVPVVTASEAVIFVDDDAAPGGNGSGRLPYNNLQDAIAAANASPDPVIIKVRSGEYVLGARRSCCLRNSSDGKARHLWPGIHTGVPCSIESSVPSVRCPVLDDSARTDNGRQTPRRPGESAVRRPESGGQDIPLDRADEAFSVRVAVRRAMRRLNDAEPAFLQPCANRRTPLGVPVADQHAIHLAVGLRDPDDSRLPSREQIYRLPGQATLLVALGRADHFETACGTLRRSRLVARHHHRTRRIHGG